MWQAFQKFKAYMFFGIGSKDLLFSTIILISIIGLALVETGFEDRLPKTSHKIKGKVIHVDNSMVSQYGLVRAGGQALEVELLEGSHKGEIVTAHNNLLGKMELDKFFVEGDLALMNLTIEGSNIVWANAADHYRLKTEMILLIVFIVFLIAYGGFTGFQAVLSFCFTILCIWKLLLPALMRGYDPLFVTFLVCAILTSTIIFLVAGINRKGLIAFLGAISGLALTCFLAVLFAEPFKVNGAVRPFSETLLFSGFTHLNLTRIFLGGIFLSASGAVMDLAIDISAAMNEVVKHHRGITRMQLLKSGFMVGRAVIGSMTTTLILAYSGGYLTMMMLFMGQGVPTPNILNMGYVSAEILHTLAGSFGLVLVAPMTAVFGAVLYIPDKGDTESGARP